MHNFISLIAISLVFAIPSTVIAGEEPGGDAEETIVISINTDDFEVEEADLSHLSIGDAETFLTDSQERLRSMESALQDMNLEIFRVQAHSLKGASATAGAETMTALALSMEKEDPDENGQNVHQLMEKMKQEYEKVRLFLSNYLGTDFRPM